jgi:cytochrome c553
MMSMMRRIYTILAILAVAQTPLVSSMASAAGSVEAGATKAAPCIACHGANGNSTNEQWPSLAGQNAVYIRAQLKAWHDKTRLDSLNLMPAMAATLSDQDMDDLAAYFSAQTPTGLEADKSYWEAGQRLYKGGDRARNIPACMACHGPVGRGSPAAGYPALRAQHSVYTVKQLTDYAADARYSRTDKGDSNGGPYAQIMHTIAAALTPEDMRNLASYVQGIR